MIEGVIYRYKSPSGKYYIGQTIDESQRRVVFLNQNCRYGGNKIDSARKKYSPENFEYTVLMKVTGDDPEEVKQYLNTLEIGFIRMYDSYNTGYNSTIGGGGLPGHKHSEETKQRISLKKYLYNPVKGKPSPKKGIPMSEESKKKMSEARLGKTPWNKGLKGVQPGYWVGKTRSEETRKKISENRKGKLKGRIALNKGKHRVYSPDGSYHYE